MQDKKAGNRFALLLKNAGKAFLLGLAVAAGVFILLFAVGAVSHGFSALAGLELARREQPPKSSPEEALQKRRLAILYGMYLDCVHTARELDSRAKQRGER